MSMLTDIEIAQANKMRKITTIAKKMGIKNSDLELHGNYIAKITMDKINQLNENKDGNLILVTSINPTSAGEGKTTTCIGLADALTRIGKKTVLCLREPSLGPCFGMKGGACGGGYSQVVPMEDINLHFTGDIHAISMAHNLLAALIDNSVFQGNPLNIDKNAITWKRVVDLNDRALRECVIGMGKSNGESRETGWDITVASEIMAILCLSSNLMELKERLANITIGYSLDGKRLTAHDLNAEGSLALLLKNAIKPNIVQTLEGTPTLIHGGPFANIAHGCNSIIATKAALKLSDYVVTEAGFGADLGAEKFLDLKCRIGKLNPKLVVIVATIRALKLHGGVNKKDLNTSNVDALDKGFANLEKHIENISKYNLPIVVAINHFQTDSKEEIALLERKCHDLGVNVVFSDVFLKGGKGGTDLAKEVVKTTDKNNVDFKFLYDTNLSIKEKILTICKEIYGADGVNYSQKASDQIDQYTKMGFGDLPICIAKTQYSLSDNPLLIGRPTGFDIEIKEMRLSSGAGFIVAIAGNIMTMPGLSKDPAAVHMDIDEKGVIKGLF